MNRSIKLAIIAPLLLSVGCTFYARSPEDYRTHTRELLDTRNADVKDCYDVALQTNETVSGNVVVNFTVEKKTGKIMNPTVDDKKSTASAEVASCVVGKIDGLTLSEPDMCDGAATFTWVYAK